MIRCKDPKCESHEDGQHTFTANAVFDDERSLAENMDKVPAGYFKCCFCGDEAEDGERGKRNARTSNES